MKVTYKGMPHALPPKEQQKLEAKFAKIGKLLDGRGEREAHVIVTQERRLCCAEITLQFHDRQLVGKGSDVDLFTAISIALEKLDSQAVKQRTKWRAAHRHKDDGLKGAPEALPEPQSSTARKSGGGASAKRIFRVNGDGRHKPMTLDEAILEMDKNRDYLVYRDADRNGEGGLSVLVRRRDGNFDLIES